MAAAAAASMGVVREVLGPDIVEEVDQPIIDYIANVLADEDFDFGAPDGHGIFEALGELLIDSGCVSSQDHCLQVSPHSTTNCAALFSDLTR
jgi:ATP-binding cassette, subfamily F, member 3